jgi:hypothetical protein
MIHFRTFISCTHQPYLTISPSLSVPPFPSHVRANPVLHHQLLIPLWKRPSVSEQHGDADLDPAAGGVTGLREPGENGRRERPRTTSNGAGGGAETAPPDDMDGSVGDETLPVEFQGRYAFLFLNTLSLTYSTCTLYKICHLPFLTFN